MNGYDYIRNMPVHIISQTFMVGIDTARKISLSSQEEMTYYEDICPGVILSQNETPCKTGEEKECTKCRKEFLEHELSL